MGKKKIEMTKEDLKNLYVDEVKTTYKIGCIYNCNRSVISRNLKKYGIKIKRYKRNNIPYFDLKPFSLACLSYKLRSIDNPVETCSIKNRVSVLKCSGANTFGSLFPLKEMMV